MATVELCSHAWHYSRLLDLQLSSIWLHPPRNHDLIVTVCYAEEDEKTASVLEWFANAGFAMNVALHPFAMEPSHLMRRAIGRDIVARETRADWVLFSDVDMLFYSGAIDSIVDNWPEGADLVYPRTVHKCTMERGDEYIVSVTKPGVYNVNPADFEPHRYRRAIGGTQYIPGDLARAKGYLPEGHRYLKPVSRWMKTNEDVCARRYLVGHRGVPVEVPNVLRIRHSQFGREHEGAEN